MSTARLEATITTKVSVARRERGSQHPRLEQVDGVGAPRFIPLSKKECIMGRDPTAHIRLASQRGSRHHATLTQRATEWSIRDNDSHNGLYLNGLRIHSAVLRDGDVLQAGDSVFVYRED